MKTSRPPFLKLKKVKMNWKNKDHTSKLKISMIYISKINKQRKQAQNNRNQGSVGDPSKIHI